MFFKSSTIAARPACTNAVNRSPNSLAVVESSRPCASTTVTSSVTSSTSFMRGSAMVMLQFLDEPQPVDPGAPRIFKLVHQGSDEVQSDAAHLAVRSRTGGRNRQRIERLAVVLHDHFHAHTVDRQTDKDVMPRRVVV